MSITNENFYWSFFYNKLKPVFLSSHRNFSNLICTVTKLLVVWQVIFKTSLWRKITIISIVYSFFRPFINSHKPNDPVDLVCVLFTSVQFPSSRTQYGRGVKGRRISGRKQRWEKNSKEAEMYSVRVTIIIRNEQYTIVMTACHMQCFHFT